MTGILKVDQWKDSGDNALMTSDGAGNLTANVSIAGFSSTGIDDNATSTAITIDNSENVGIGCTPETWYNTFSALQIGANKSAIYGRSENNQLNLASNSYVNGSGNNTYINSSEASLYEQNSGVHKFFTASSGTAGNTITFTERMSIDNNGQVSKPAQSSFRAGRSGNYTPGSGNDIVFNTVSGGDHYNIGNDYNTSNGRFTAPAAGRYLFITQVLWGPSVADGTNMVDSIRFTTNGSERTYGSRRAYYRNTYTGDGGYFGDFTTDIFNLNTNDYVTVRAKKGNSVHGNDQYTIFTGYFLG